MKKKIFSTLLLVAFALASTSMFVSCKDYDDDINKNSAAITKLQELINGLQTQLNECKTSCAAAHATFATKAELASLQEEIAGLVTAAQLEEALAAAKEAYDLALAGKVDKGDFDELATTVASINEALARAFADGGVASINDLEALKQNLEGQINALKAYEDRIAALEGQLKDADGNPVNIAEQITAITSLITGLQGEVNNLKSMFTDDEVAALKSIVKEWSGNVDTAGFVNMNILQFLLDRQLGSLVFKSEFRVLGVPAIEVPALVLQPVVKVTNAGTGAESWQYVHIDADGNEYLKGDYDKDAPNYLQYDNTWTYSDVRNDPWTFVVNYVNKIKEDYKFISDWELPAVAKYHINPSTANLDGAQLRFFANTELVVEEIESRYMEGNKNNFAVANPSTVGSTKDVVNGGILSVQLKLSNWKDYVKFLAETADGNYVKNKWNITGFKLNGDEEAASLQDSVNFVALQVIKGDTTVTSDYAAVIPAAYHITALADNAPEVVMPAALDCGNKQGWSGNNGKGAHMYKTALDAINNPATHTVVYNGSIDLAPFVETHFTYIGAKSAWYDYDHTMSAEIFKQLGLKYHYEIIEYMRDIYGYYTDGINGTNQSVHIQHYDSNPSVFYPRSVKEDGTQIPDQVALQNAIGREPLVRVTLENVNGDVYEVGYIKLHIAGEEKVQDVDIAFNEPIYINCATEAALTWAQIENRILGTLDISREVFENQYTIDYSGGQCTRFILNENGKYINVDDYVTEINKEYNAKINATTDQKQKAALMKKRDTLIAKARVGAVIRTWTDYSPKQTDVLKWRFYTAADYADLLLAGGISVESEGVSTEDIVTTVRFKRNGSNESYLYVTLRIPAGMLHMAYSAVSGKILRQWYQFEGSDGLIADGTVTLNDKTSEGRATSQEDALEVHIQVPTPAEHYPAGPVKLASNEFVKDLNDFFLNGTIGYDQKIIDHFGAFAGILPDYEFIAPVNDGKIASFDADEDGVWKVMGNSGTVYSIKVSADGNRVETVSGTTIVYLTAGSQVHFANNNVAFDILNYVGRFTEDKDVENANYMNEHMSFTAFVKIKSEACYPMLMKNQFFRLRFLRPLNMMGNDKNWRDAFSTPQKLKAQDLVFIRDWRAYETCINSGSYSDPSINKPEDILKGKVKSEFYDVTELLIDEYGMYTDMANPRSDALKPSQVDEIRSLNLTSQLRSLQNSLTVTNKVDGTLTYSEITYTNNGGTVGEFHIYVPVTITYAFGTRTQKVYAVITVGSTTAKPSFE